MKSIFTRPDMGHCIECLSILVHTGIVRLYGDIQRHFRTYILMNSVVHKFHQRMDVHTLVQYTRLDTHILQSHGHTFYYRKPHQDNSLCNLIQWKFDGTKRVQYS